MDLLLFPCNEGNEGRELRILVAQLSFRQAGNEARFVQLCGSELGLCDALLLSRYAPRERPGLPSAPIGDCIGDRSLLHLQQINSKISPRG